MDVISLKGIEVFARHGVLEEEQEQGQTFVVDVDASLDLTDASGSDDLNSTLDYGLLAEAVHDRVASERWNLIERVAQRVADVVMEDDRVQHVVVTVHKPEAPISVRFSDVSVTIQRSRGHDEA